MTDDLFAKTLNYERRELRRAAEESGLSPYFRVMSTPPTAVAALDGRECVMLGSSNYLGLAGDRRLVAAAQRAATEYGTSLNGSRCMNGTTPLHLELENTVAGWLGEEAALVFPSGYTANLGCISPLVGDGDVAIVDVSDHASILDAAALAPGRIRRFRHHHLPGLRKLLWSLGTEPGGRLVIVDAVYSMQGDLPDVAAIAQICAQHGARLLVDEAHAVGVLGPHGTGVCALAGVVDRVDLRMGTFSKAFAAGGGFVAGPADVIDYLRAHSRPFLFTAATPPPIVGAALAGLTVARSAEGDERRARLADNARYLRDGLRQLGLGVPEAPPLGDGTVVASPIVAIPLGDELSVVRFWNLLYQQGIYVNAAIHPAVPRGRAQLRLSVMATHRREHLDRALAAVDHASRLVREGVDELALLPAG